jgi:hypothetical protein
VSLVKSPQSQATTDAAEPTLGALLTTYARTGVPTRLYQMLQLGIPVAIDWGLHGHWRAAAAGLALASLGAWGLADRWLYEAEPGGPRRRLVRGARAIAGTVAAVIPAVLVVELFFHLLGNAPIS